MMMDAVDDETNDRFDDQLLKDNIFTFLFAEYETTATAIPGVLYYLAKVNLLKIFSCARFAKKLFSGKFSSINKVQCS